MLVDVSEYSLGCVEPPGCYCGKDQGAGYTYRDEYGACEVCLAICPCSAWYRKGSAK